VFTMNKYRCLLIIAVAAFVGAGCSSGTPELSKEDASKMKGGPMPPGTWEKMAASRKKWAEEHKANNTANNTNNTGQPTK